MDGIVEYMMASILQVFIIFIKVIAAAIKMTVASRRSQED